MRRRFSLLIFLLVLLAAVELGFRRGMSFGRFFAFMDIGGFALGMMWKVVLVVIVLLWLKSALGKKGD
jgi:hypothetical protein